MKQLFRLFAGASLLALAACHAPDSTSSKQAAGSSELKVYTVPPAQTGQLAGALRSALGSKASVTSPAPGKLLVYAAPDAQASIGKAIAAIEPASATPASITQVGLHFWVVDGEPGTGSDDAALKPLASALDGLRKSMGPLRFTLDQVVSARTSAGGSGTSIESTIDDGYPRAFDFMVRAVDGEALDLQLAYDDHGNRGLAKFKSEVHLRSGQYVVLAQGPGSCAPALPGKSTPPCPTRPALRLLVVRADILPPQA
ncbi:hypothetical protein I6J77_02655 [Rhodanobacter sp. FDAARGOS 1247]|uniref:hypothetical protein n=1 Tax=Rhodanobacter sp. FDAARGOS 1247 TaxID=2778082 RepID=UPI00194F01A7|nr:hypothetical protein [Rhodanobacter sp. FDAARGOS 1247]QRP64382.1 hypothetical protein I6J77_02655 [Rhodanobacter sp. FDAARGOS 1247]